MTTLSRKFRYARDKEHLKNMFFLVSNYLIWNKIQKFTF